MFKTRQITRFEFDMALRDMRRDVKPARSNRHYDSHVNRFRLHQSSQGR
jgi:hypothetical protein